MHTSLPLPQLTTFKAYDLRGRLPHELNPHFAELLGHTLVQQFAATNVVVGEDIRPSSASLRAALVRGLTQAGASVHVLGLCGTEQVYHAVGLSAQNPATAAPAFDLGIMVTASHNPADYNGFKIVKRGAAPFTAEEDMPALKTAMLPHLQAGTLPPAASAPGQASAAALTPQPLPAAPQESYIQKLLSFVDASNLKPLHVVVNAGHGCAGPVVDALEAHLPLKFTKIHHTPDGTFPAGIPNPLLPQNRAATCAAVRQHGADFGVAWDGDFDRCFLFDETGTFINAYYLVGLLARPLMAAEKAAGNPAPGFAFDSRLMWDSEAVAAELGVAGHVAKVGHGHFKKLLRQTGAAFGGEVAAHFYFRDFYYCDSGMLPWLLIAQLLSQSGQSLSQLVAARQAQFHASDEHNFPLTIPAAEAMAAMEETYGPAASASLKIDGLCLSFNTPNGNWRLSLRASSNEPLLRLNLEATTADLFTQKEQELLGFLRSLNQAGTHAA